MAPSGRTPPLKHHPNWLRAAPQAPLSSLSPCVCAGAAGWLKSTLAAPGIAAKYSGVLNGIGAQAGGASAQRSCPRRAMPVCTSLQAASWDLPLSSTPCTIWLCACSRRPPRSPAHLTLLHPHTPADTSFWDPTTDPFLPACYDAQRQEGKALCKRFLQEVRPSGSWVFGGFEFFSLNARLVVALWLWAGSAKPLVTCHDTHIMHTRRHRRLPTTPPLYVPCRAWA